MRARPYLFKAIKENNMQNLAALFQAGFPLWETVQHPGITALMLAASIGTPECCQLILQSGQVDINQRDRAGRSALHFACKAGNLATMRCLLTVPGLNFELRTHGGQTPLIHATQSGDIYIVAECLNRGFNPF